MDYFISSIRMVMLHGYVFRVLLEMHTTIFIDVTSQICFKMQNWGRNIYEKRTEMAVKLGDGSVESTTVYSLEMFEFAIRKVFFFKSYNENYNAYEFWVISRCRTKHTTKFYVPWY